MNEDQVRGRIEEAKGKIKEVAGRAVGNGEMEKKGLLKKRKGIKRAELGDKKEDIKKSM
jgi:uncharacterized protein YjbJ (UPF0337 family)